MLSFRILRPSQFQSTFPRGERRSGHDSHRGSVDFNPRSLVGNDHVFFCLSSDNTQFQSTFPRGERPCGLLLSCLPRYFNPRSLVGNDIMSSMYFSTSWISIHVPSWGTTIERLQTNVEKNFNPRSLVGNDGKFSQIFFVFLCNKYNFSTFYYPFSLFFSVIHVTFLIFVVRILPAFYVYF